MPIVIGLLADPALPAEIADQLASELPNCLATGVSQQTAWEVRIVHETLAVDEEGGIPISGIADERLAREGWDLAVVLTDRPQRAGTQPILGDVSVSHGVGLLSLPALGAVNTRKRARDTIVQLIAEMAKERLELGDGGHQRSRESRPAWAQVGRARWQTPSDEDVDLRIVVPGVHGRVRLLAGMVRANRPWRLALGLSSALAAALAASAFGLVSTSVWLLGDTMGGLRQATTATGAIGAMVVWLIVAHGLWEDSRKGTERRRARLYNLSTVVTLTLGVVCFYAALFALNLIATGLVLSPGLFRSELSHQVSWTDYVALASLTSSMGTIAGAVGSGLESDTAVREAAYSHRELQRQIRRRQTDSRSKDHEPASPRNE